MTLRFIKLSTLALAGTLSLPALAITDLPTIDPAEEVAVLEIAFGDPVKLDDRDRQHRGNRRANLVRRAKRICARVNATEAQKAEIMERAFEFKEAAIELKADLDQAKLAYLRAVLAPEGEITTASTAATAGVTAASGLLTAKTNLVTGILFEVLMQEQRRPALACMKAIAKLKKKAK